MTTALDIRVLLEKFGDGGLERIQLAGALSSSGGAGRRGQVLGDGSTPQVEMTSNLAHRPLLGEVQAMNGVDLFCRQHGLAATYTASRVGKP